MLKVKGPLLIAANHPNSFLDAIILSTLFNQPIHSLTRGDVFTKKFHARLLRSLNMMPVYRISEGAENLEHNYSTFEVCKEVFRKNGIVLIFSEGGCINEWHLRPLKKGTARLAISCWQDGIDLKILPTGINYNSFTSFGKNIRLNFGNIIEEKDINKQEGYGKTITSFNQLLLQELQPQVIQLDKKDSTEIKDRFYIKQSKLKKTVLFIPALAGYLFHLPLYYPIQKFTWKKASKNDHYDSILVGLLFVLYPFYLLIASFILFLLTGSLWSFFLLIIAPFCAWSYVQLKKQF